MGDYISHWIPPLNLLNINGDSDEDDDHSEDDNNELYVPDTERYVNSEFRELFRSVYNKDNERLYGKLALSDDQKLELARQNNRNRNRQAARPENYRNGYN